jgi:hypothetical protein
MEMRKKGERGPIKTDRYEEESRVKMDVEYEPVDSGSRNRSKFTDTMYKLEELKQLEKQRAKKIKAILEDSQPITTPLNEKG